MKPNKIYIDNFSCYSTEPKELRSVCGGEEVAYIRADKVTEILKSRRDNILLGRPMWALSEDQQSEVYCIMELIKQFEAL